MSSSSDVLAGFAVISGFAVSAYAVHSLRSALWRAHSTVQRLTHLNHLGIERALGASAATTHEIGAAIAESIIAITGQHSETVVEPPSEGLDPLLAELGNQDAPVYGVTDWTDNEDVLMEHFTPDPVEPAGTSDPEELTEDQT